MKTLKSIFAVLILSLFAISCSKNDDSKPTISSLETTSLLTKTIDSDDGLTSTYVYNNEKQLINYKRSMTVNNAALNQNFIYNADGTLAQITSVIDGSIVSKYFYDANKKVIKKEGRNGTDVFNYTYIDNQIFEKYFFNTVATWIQVYTNDANGNVIELKTYNQITAANPNGTLSGAGIYTYDTKKNALLSLPSQYLFPKNNLNNIVTEKYNSNPIFNYIYEYNDKKYPVKLTTTYVRTYEYQ